MPIRAYLQFYKSIIPFILMFTLLSFFIFGLVPSFIIFLTIGIFIGFLTFYLIKKKEFYFYYNLGISKWKLFRAVFLINLILGVPIVLIILFIISFFIGDISII